MTMFRAYAANFELHPKDSEAFRVLLPLLARLKRIDFVLRVADPSANQGQMDSDFDAALEKAILLLSRSATTSSTGTRAATTG